MRLNKYKAKRTNGFHSKLESAVYALLELRQNQGEISDIKCQQTVILVDGPPDTQIKWKVDFSFVDNKTNERVYAEAKGIETEDYKLKLKLWRKFKPAALEIWKGTYQRPFLSEVVK